MRTLKANIPLDKEASRDALGGQPPAFVGRGGVWVTAFGAIEEVQVPPGETAIVDNFHFVAMEEGASYTLRTVGGLKSTLFGGEGLVAEIRGPARLWLQTRPIVSLVDTLLPLLKRHLIK